MGVKTLKGWQAIYSLGTFDPDEYVVRAYMILASRLHISWNDFMELPIDYMFMMLEIISREEKKVR